VWQTGTDWRFRSVLRSRKVSSWCQVIDRPKSAGQQLNRSHYKNGAGLCNPSELTPSEMKDVIAAEHQRNAQNCENGWDECDHSNLTPSEAKQTSYSEMFWVGTVLGQSRAASSRCAVPES